MEIRRKHFSENIFLQLMKSLTPSVSFKIFMDNYFTSFCLLTHIGVNSIQAIHVLNKYRLYGFCQPEHGAKYWYLNEKMLVPICSIGRFRVSGLLFRVCGYCVVLSKIKAISLCLV